MTARSVALIAVFLLAWAAWQGPAAAQDPGYEAYRNKDYATALKHWLPRAEAGEVVMQYYVGASYEMGGEPGKAAQWYAKAVRGNNAEALERLIVVAFAQGYDNDASLAAMSTLTDRARGGNAAGLYDLGRYYEARAYWDKEANERKDLGGADMRTAWALYRLAAERGLAMAAEQADRVWPFITTKVGKDHARALVGRWRQSLFK